MFLSLGGHRTLVRAGCSLALLYLLVFVAGCGKESQIRSYDAPTDQIGSRGGGQQTASERMRMVAAIVPKQSQAWFFKLVGPEETVDDVTNEVEAFLITLFSSENEPDAVKWTVPHDWTEGPARPMREATLLIPAKPEPLELAISTLGFDGNTEPFLLANVNRWRGQLGLPAIQNLDDRGSGVHMLDPGKTWLFDAVGTAPPTPPMGEPPSASPSGASPAQPPPSPIAGEPEITFATPEGWSEAPPRPMVRRVLAVGSAPDAANIAVSDFPASAPAIADPLENMNRWRGMVSLPPVDQAQVASLSEATPVGDDRGRLMQMASEDGAQAILVAMVEKLDRVWFFKMTGTLEQIASERDTFITWLKTVNIKQATVGEKGDGNTETSEEQ